MKNRNLLSANSCSSTTTDVVVEEQEFAESKSSAAAGSAGGAAYTPSRPEPSAAAGDGFMNIPDGVDDEGLPFN